MAQPSLHPSIDNGITQGTGSFGGGTLYCKCPSDKVAVEISGDVAHNHACGCSKCWKPDGALFSVVGVVPVDKLKVTAHGEKLKPVDPSAAIVRHACTQCGTHMYGRIEKDHPFKGLDFIHTELSDKTGWQAPQFAAFVSSIIEQGFEPSGMDGVRNKFHSVGLKTYDCLAPGLMDLIAGFSAKKAGTEYKEGQTAGTGSSPSKPASSTAPSGSSQKPAENQQGGIAGFFNKLFGG